MPDVRIVCMLFLLVSPELPSHGTGRASGPSVFYAFRSSRYTSLSFYPNGLGLKTRTQTRSSSVTFLLFSSAQ